MNLGHSVVVQDIPAKLGLGGTVIVYHQRNNMIEHFAGHR